MTNSCMALIFLASVSYSGSTLLSFLLGTHPRIATIGEMTGIIRSEDPDQYRCSCGKVIRECDFWQSVATEMSYRGFKFDVAHFDTTFELGASPLIRRLRTGSLRANRIESLRDLVFQLWPGQNNQLSRIGTRNQALAESILHLTGKSVFLDASKNHMRIKYLLRYTNLDIGVIHLVRDVRGVVNSFLSHKKWMTTKTAASRWVNFNRNTERQLRALTAERHVRVRYEDLCQDVPGTLERLHRFCGVEPGFFLRDFRSVAHHTIGNKMRLSDSSEIELDERWKTTLTKTQFQEIDRIAGPVNRAYGYD
jgi:hypothetical protein